MTSYRKNMFLYAPHVFFLLYTLWWILAKYELIPALIGKEDLFTTTYGLLAAYGGTIGIFVARKWGGFKSLMGKAIILFSMGLLSQEFGQLAYSYYIYIQKIDVPYPSWGDVGYFATIPFYILGVVYLAQASGVRVSLKSMKSQLQALLIPIVILIYSYFVFLQGYVFNYSQPLTIFLDFGYPLGHAIYVSLALLTYLLSRKILGGIMRKKILLILFAMIIQYVADYTFLYQVSREIWIVSGVSDYLFLVSYYIMTLAIINLRLSVIKSKL